MKALALSIALLTAGCGAVVTACPPITKYSAEVQTQAADELEAAIAAGAVVVPRMMGDYMILRDQIRKCRS